MAESAAPTTGGLPFVRIVVLNWNAAWLTTRCVRSLQQSTYPADRREIVVVDNASIDGSLQRLEADLHGVRFLPNPHNLGFAEGNNHAITIWRAATWFALVNNDAVVDPGWLEPLVDALRDDASAGAAAPKMLLETPFVSIALIGAASIATVEIDGVDVTRRCIYATWRSGRTRPSRLHDRANRGRRRHDRRTGGGPSGSVVALGDHHVARGPWGSAGRARLGHGGVGQHGDRVSRQRPRRDGSTASAPRSSRGPKGSNAGSANATTGLSRDP